MANVERLNCCGMSEMADIFDGSPEDSLMSVNPAHQAFVVFSEVQERRHESLNCGRRIKALIEKCNLGAVVSMTMSENPNTENRVKPYLWRVNRKALARWQKRMRKEDPNRWQHWRFNHAQDDEDPYYNPYGGGW